jgi:tetratricopeptide (TPR) repeat protein
MDYIPYNYLIMWYGRLNELDKAKKTALRALDEGHTGQLLLTLAGMENQAGDYDQAEAYYKRFAKEFPHKSKDVTGLGNTYLARGDFEKAQVYFERMNLLEPTNTNVIRKLAEIQGKKGNYDKQLALYKEALSLEKQLSDSITIFQEIEAVYMEKGQINTYFEMIEQRWELSKYALPPYMEGMYMLYPANIIAMLDQKGRENILEELLGYARIIDKTIADSECIAKGNYYIFAEEKEALEATLKECDTELEKYQTDVQNAIIQAYTQKVYGNYDEALKQIQTALEKSKINPNNFMIIGEIYAAQKDYKNAITHFESMLIVDPTSPKVLLELAKIYQETGESGKAKAAINKALEIWKDADENYIPAIQAREVLSSI